jgi:phosphinothricin acetyltransferase
MTVDPVEIALAEAGDVPAIAEIANWAALHTTANFATEPEPSAAWAEDWRRTHAMYPWLVARHGAGRRGFAKASPHRSRGAYAFTAEVTVYVHPDHHGRGIGRELYRVLLDLLRAQGYVTLLAGITLPNPASERLHASFGFRQTGTFPRAGWKLGGWHDVAYWALHLAGDAPPAPLRPVADVWSSDPVRAPR